MALAFKLTTMALKQMLKPMAASLTKSLQTQPQFRSAAVSFGQWYHAARTNIAHYAEGNDGAKVFVSRIQEDRAVALAVSMLSEGIVYGGSAGLFLFEYNRQQQSAETKQRELEQRRSARQEAARRERELLDARIGHLEASVEELLAAHRARRRGWFAAGAA